MDSELCAHLQCPICLEIPENEIYQCEEGHSICARCFRSVTNCPQCRVPFGSKKLRNRTMESLIQDLALSCPYEGHGCRTRIKRNQMQQHVDNCDFEPVEFCQTLGYASCGFKISRANKTEIVPHLKQVHHVISREAPSAYIHLEVGSTAASSKVEWAPIILDVAAEPGHPIHLFTIEVDNDEEEPLNPKINFSFMPVRDVIGSGYTAWVYISSGSSTSYPCLKWTAEFVGEPVEFEFPFNLLKEYYLSNNGKLNLTVGVTTDNELVPENVLIAQGSSQPCIISPI